MTSALPQRAAHMAGRAFAFAAAVLVAVALPGGPARAAVDVKEVTSPSGLSGWLIQDETVPAVTLSFAFRGGAALDPKGKEGLAEMASGLLDEGAGDLPSREFQALLENNSISLRFSAGMDSFSGTLRMLNETRDLGVDLLHKALTVPRFDAEPVERIRRQLLSEVRRRNERPSSLAGRAWDDIVFPNHPYGREAGGTEDSLKAITADDLRGFVTRRFARDNLVIGAVGDITPADFGALMDRVFAGLPETSTAGTVPEAEVKGAGTVEVIDRAIPQSIMLFGEQGLKRDDPDYYAADVMMYILGGGGLTSRLAEEVREKRGLAYSVSASLSTYDHAGLIVGQVQTQNARAAETLAIIRKEWNRMREEPVDGEELEDAKLYLTGSFYTRLSSTRRLVGTLIAIQLENLGIDYFQRRDDLLNAVSTADVQRVAKRLLDPGKLRVVVVGRPEGIESRP